MEPWSRRDTLCAAVLGLFFLLLYTLTRSAGPDDWDSVQFMWGMDEFNLRKHQPHPPGYPLYVLSGWLVRALTGWDSHTALTGVSALGGGVLVAAVFGLGRQAFSRRASLAGALAAGLIPAIWLNSIKAMTDIPASAVLLAAVAFATAAWVHRRPAFVLAAAVLAGLAAGFRPQNAFVLLIIVVLGSWRMATGWRWAAVGVWVATGLSWLVPTMHLQAKAVGGSFWTAYWVAAGNQFRWRLDKSNVYAGAALEQDPFLIERLLRHLGGWFSHGLAPLGHPLFVVFCVLLAVGWMGCGVLIWRELREKESPLRRIVGLCLVWMLPYALMIFLFLPSDRRYYVPLLAPMALAAVAGWELWLGRLSWRTRWGIFLGPMLLVVAVFPLAWENHTEAPPPVRSLTWLCDQIPVGEREGIVFVPDSCRRHLEWLQPGFTNVSRQNLSKLLEDPEKIARVRGVYTDNSNLPQQAGHPEWVLVPLVAFERSDVIHSKHRRSVIYRVEGLRVNAEKLKN